MAGSSKFIGKVDRLEKNVKGHIHCLDRSCASKIKPV